jgi:hypothetical protein
MRDQVRFGSYSVSWRRLLNVRIAPRKRTQVGRRGMSEMCHVWTAPSWQGKSSRRIAGRCSVTYGTPVIWNAQFQSAYDIKRE